MNAYLFLDTETGGLDPRRHSLLSLGLVAGDADGMAESLEILVRHETYGVTGGGLKVNRIDLATHHEKALPPAAALEALDGFLDRHYSKEDSIILVGHNIAFDRAFLGGFLESQGRDPEPRFSHRSIDTHSVAAALQDAGRLPAQVRLSSTGLFAHFGIDVPEAQRHTALGDAVATFALYWKLVEAAR
jgi:DNA polymerase III epsilon subunit-like protein